MRTWKWWPLAVAGLAQVMVVLDATVVTIALPAMQQQLGMSDLARGWVITAYALAFGGLLLIGGRLVERLGQRRGFVIGLIGFGFASLFAGVAPSAELLFAGRAVQGAFAALLAPAALTIVSATYSAGKDRARAFGVYGALNGAGAALGLLLGGLFTEYVSWRWCLLINVPIVVVALMLTRMSIRRGAAQRVRFDFVGALTSAVAIAALVFALTEGASFGWSSWVTIGCFALAIAGFAAFVVAHRFTEDPILPFGVLLHRRRGAALIAIGLPQMALFGFYLVLTYWFQSIFGYPAILAGVAFLPLAVAIVLGSTFLSALIARRLSARVVITGALSIMAIGMLVLVGVNPDSGSAFVTRFLPAQLLIGLGLGISLSLAIPEASEELPDSETGTASGAVNMVTQLGGAIGLAILNTIAAGVTAAASESPATDNSARVAAIAGYDAAMLAAAGVLVLAAILVFAVRGRLQPYKRRLA